MLPFTRPVEPGRNRPPRRDQSQARARAHPPTRESPNTAGVQGSLPRPRATHATLVSDGSRGARRTRARHSSAAASRARSPIPAPAVAPSDPRFETHGRARGRSGRVGGGARERLRAPARRGRELLALPPTGAGANRHDLAAGPGIALVQRLACTNSACTRNRGRDALRVDLQTGAAAPFNPCAECFYPREIFNQRFQLRGTVLAVGGARADGVFDLADGTSRTNLGDISAAAGRFAVVDGRLRPAPRRLADRRADPPRPRRLPRSALQRRRIGRGRHDRVDRRRGPGAASR